MKGTTMYQERYYSRRQKPSTLLGTIARFIAFAMLAIAALVGGLWVLGAVLGIGIGLFALAVTIAPVILIGWLIWVVLKAIFA
jgi:hypothetical protein